MVHALLVILPLLRSVLQCIVTAVTSNLFQSLMFHSIDSIEWEHVA